MSQEEQLQKQLQAEDEQLAALLSRNMWLSEERQLQKPQQQTKQLHPPVSLPQASADLAPTQQVTAAPGVNFSISQHYHHYRPVVPPIPTPVPSPFSGATQGQNAPPSSPPPPPTYLQHLLNTSSDPEAALRDYHHQLALVEQQYNLRLQEQHAQYPPSPTGSTVSSIQDDHQLQMLLLEQHNVAQEAERLRLNREREEEQMILNQLRLDTSNWQGGQPMPNSNHPHHHQEQMAPEKVVYPATQPWVADTDMDEMGGDEESPCVIYYSRMYNSHYL